MAGDYYSTWQDDATLPKCNSSPANTGELCNGQVTSSNTGCGVDNAIHSVASKRHLDGANYLFADGHVKSFRPEQIYGQSTPFSVSGSSPTFRVDN